MIAHILPIKRVPAHLETFSYTVPDALKADIAIGQLTTIPFRQSIIFGLVLSFEDKNDPSLKEMDGLVHTEPILAAQHVALIQMIHTAYGVALGTMAKLMLPPLQKRKLKQIAPVPLPTIRATKRKQKPHYQRHTDEAAHTNVLQTNAQGATLILVPEVQYIDRVTEHLSAEAERLVTWHGDLSTKEKFARWFQIRNGEKDLIIGTRSACLLPFPALDTIILDYEQHEQHKHWDQAPRFHAKDIATWLAHTYTASLHMMSSSPSCDAYFAVHKKLFKGSLGAFTQHADRTEIVDMTEERRAGRFALLSDTIKDALRNATQDVFLFIQRRGFSTSVGCNQCGFVSQCTHCQLPYIYHEQSHTLRCHYCGEQQRMITHCPNCSIDAVVLRGAGTAFLESGLRTFFGNDKTKDILRIDSDLPYHDERVRDDATQRIVVGTEMALPHVRWKQTDTIILVDIDKQLTIPEFRAGEHVWHLLNQIQYERHDDAILYIQTHNPMQLVLRGLAEPDRFYRTELNARKQLGYPPYTYLVRYFYGADSEAGAKKEVERVHTTLTTALTKHKKSAMLSAPVEMHPRYFRKKYWYTFLAKLHPGTAQEELPWINTHIPTSWKIDPNPISILHP